MSGSTVSISSMGSGTLPASKSYLYILRQLADWNLNSTGNDTVAGLHTTHPEIHLAIIYGITVAGLVVLAVVTVVITIVYHRRQEDTRTHYRVAKTRGTPEE